MITASEPALSGERSLPSALLRVQRALEPVSITARLDAQVLLAHLLGQSRGWLLAHPEATLGDDAWPEFIQAVRKLEGGMPLPYVLGRWEFYGLELEVTPDVLIPRPETELLVETAIAWLKEQASQATSRPLWAADAGTGSGAIAISLARAIPGLKLVAVDRSRAALGVAQRNARRHQVEGQVHFYQGDLLQASGGPFDLVAANLPYIPTGRLAGLPVAAHEPRLALDGGPDGLETIARLLRDLRRLLHPGGLALLEIEASQGPAMIRLARRVLRGATVTMKPDLAGRDRLAVISFSPAPEKDRA